MNALPSFLRIDRLPPSFCRSLFELDANIWFGRGEVYIDSFRKKVLGMGMAIGGSGSANGGCADPAGDDQLGETRISCGFNCTAF